MRIMTRRNAGHRLLRIRVNNPWPNRMRSAQLLLLMAADTGHIDGLKRFLMPFFVIRTVAGKALAFFDQGMLDFIRHAEFGVVALQATGGVVLFPLGLGKNDRADPQKKNDQKYGFKWKSQDDLCFYGYCFLILSNSCWYCPLIISRGSVIVV